MVPFPLWYTEKDLEVYHRSVCRVISGCLASTPFPLLLLESLTPPPLEITLTTEHSPSTNGDFASLQKISAYTTASLLSSTTQIKEETFLTIFLLITGKPSPQRKTDLMPIRSPLDPPNFTVTTFIEGRKSVPKKLDFLWFCYNLVQICILVKNTCVKIFLKSKAVWRPGNGF